MVLLNKTLTFNNTKRRKTLNLWQHTGQATPPFIGPRMPASSLKMHKAHTIPHQISPFHQLLSWDVQQSSHSRQCTNGLPVGGPWTTPTHGGIGRRGTLGGNHRYQWHLNKEIVAVIFIWFSHEARRVLYRWWETEISSSPSENHKSDGREERCPHSPQFCWCTNRSPPPPPSQKSPQWEWSFLPMLNSYIGSCIEIRMWQSQVENEH